MSKKNKLDSKYSNPNGNYTDEEFDKLCNQDFKTLELFLKNFRIVDNKCPPTKRCNEKCFRCTKCFAKAIGDNFYKKIFNIAEE